MELLMKAGTGPPSVVVPLAKFGSVQKPHGKEENAVRFSKCSSRLGFDRVRR
jgi:hypothetical protein